MYWADLIGYIASILVVLTFYMDKMVALRVTAVLSNIAFLAYGIGLELGPVVALHGTLLPLNIWRLRQLSRTCPSSDRPADPTRSNLTTARVLSSDVPRA
jgi:hypothetical protein